jgi:hypothetical protein
MNADSAIMTGWVEPGGVMDRMGDFPRGWIFLSSGGAKCDSGWRLKVSSS